MMKARLAGAHKGHNLLKRKADALQLRFRMILGKIIEVINDFLYVTQYGFHHNFIFSYFRPKR